MKAAKTALDTLCGRGQWVLTTNHRKLAILYFGFVVLTGFVGLILATIIRIELAYPGQAILTQNSERYLTLISVHGIVMVFFVVIPLIFGAFGNFLLPTQLGVRDVAFPRLNSFMFWVTPSGFVLLLHTLLFDRSYTVTHWLNYGEVRAHLRRRYQSPQPMPTRFSSPAADTVLAWRLANPTMDLAETRATLLRTSAPALDTTSVGDPAYIGHLIGSTLKAAPGALNLWFSSLSVFTATGLFTGGTPAPFITSDLISLSFSFVFAAYSLVYGDFYTAAGVGAALFTCSFSALALVTSPYAGLVSTLTGKSTLTLNSSAAYFDYVPFYFFMPLGFTPAQPFYAPVFTFFDVLFTYVS